MTLSTQIGPTKPGPATLFAAGLAIVMLSLTISIQPVWDTFMLPWRIELLASAVLLAFLIFGISKLGISSLSLEKSEWYSIVAPIVAFIGWSSISAAWSNSPRAALHHTLVWSLYLGFYLCFRLLLQQRNSYSQFLSSLSLPLIFFSSLAILGYITILIVGRGSALGIIYSKWGEQVNTLLPLLLIGVLCAKGKRFYSFALGFVLLWLMVYVSASRSAIGLFVVGFVVVSLSVFISQRYHRFRPKVAEVAAILLVITALLNVIPGLISNSDSPTVSRFTDTAHLNGSNDFRWLMVTLGMEMIKDKPITGVGADNFGFEVNRYRAAYAAKNPADPTLIQAETSIPERTHNEYLQIASELGIVGAGIFAWFLLGIAATCLRAVKRHRSVPPHALAASLGLVLFLAGSLVTSYSFRLVQNGIVFFFVLAVLQRSVNKTTERAASGNGALPLGALRLAGVTACVLLIGLSGVRVTSVAITKAAHSEPNIDTASKLYEDARELDPENPEPAYYLAIRLLKEGQYDESALLFKESIRIGKAPSVDYSYLASAQFLAGDIEAAEQTLAEAAVIYPHSVFVLARYSVILSMNGKPDAAAVFAARARSIDSASANTWLALIEFGPKKASEMAFQDVSYKAVMDLEPYDCIYAVITERDIRFPEERMKIPFELARVTNTGH